MTFFYENDLDFSGTISNDYAITVIGTAGNVDVKTGEATFDLTIKNPCIDSTYVSISSSPLEIIYYNVGEGAKSFEAHSPFTIVTVPNTHSLCGDISYEGMFNGAAFDGGPLAYNADTRVFTAESQDQTLIGNIYSYSVVATLASYPSS